MINQPDTIERLMKLTGKGRFACDIALSLAGGDFSRAVDRMRISYPSMRLPDDPPPTEKPVEESPKPVEPEEPKPKPKPWEQ